VDVTRLLYFRTVVEAGGLTKAAPLLQITAGSLSKAMRQLEAEVGHSLFVPSGRTRELTARGRALYAASERLADEYERLRRSLERDEPTTDEPLRLASFEPFTTHTLGATLARGLAGLELRVLEVGLGEIERAVETDSADVGVTYAPYPSRGLHFESLGRADFGIYTGVGAFAETAFETLPFCAPITRVGGSAVHLLGADGWPYDRVRRRVKYHLTSLESALELARRGLCAVFLPSFVAGHHNATVQPASRLERRANPPGLRPVRHTAHLVTRSERRDEPRLQRFGRALLGALREGARMAETCVP
jgi:DNA-binding transcriptional LysR family regulator